MALSPHTLRDDLVAELSVERLLELLGIDRADTVKVGETLKAVCPVCNTRAFKTLFLDGQRKMFGCRYTMCEAHRGEGDFLQLVSMAKGISEEEAIHLVAAHLGLDVPEGSADELAADLETKGLEALGQGDLTSARNLLERAAATAQSHGEHLSADINAKIAHCCWELDDKGAARMRYRQVFAQLQDEGRQHDALLTISDLIHTDHEWAPELHLILARMLKGEGDDGAALTHALEAANDLRRTGLAELADEATALAVEIDPDSDAVKCLQVEAALGQGDWESVREGLEALLRVCDEAETPDRALLVLARLDEVGQLPAEMQIRRAELAEATGRAEEANAIWQGLIPAAANDESLAVRVAERLLRDEERRPEQESQLLRVFIRAQRFEEAHDSLHRLIALGSDEQIIREAFSALAAVRPDDLTLRQARLEWLASLQDSGEDLVGNARNILRDAVEAGDATIAERAWDLLAPKLEGEQALAIRAESIAQLHGLTRERRHRDAWTAVIRDAHEAKALELVTGQGERFLADVGFDPEVARFTIGALQQRGQLAEQADLARDVLAAQREAQDWKGAERTLLLLIDALPDEEADPLWDQLGQVLHEGGDSEAAAAIHLQRAEALLTRGETPLAERQLRAAREAVGDPWSHWRRERAAVRRAKHEGIMERLAIEAIEAATAEEGDDTPATLALLAEAEEGVLESLPFARLASILAERGEVERADLLVQEHGDAVLGQGIDGQRELTALLAALPGCAAAWRLAIERVNDSEAVHTLQGQLATLAKEERLEVSERLALIQRASVRWPDSLLSLEALAEAQRAASHEDEALKTEQQIANRLISSGDPSRAVTLLRRLVEDQPEHPVLCRQLGFALEKAGEPEEAGAVWLSMATHLSETGGDSALIREALENARRLCGETPEVLAAEFDFCEIAQDQKGATERAIALASRHAEEGDHSAALDVLRQCTERFGETLGLLHAQAHTLASAGEKDAAARTWRRVLDRHWEREEWSECTKALESLNDLEPENIEDDEHRAELEQRLGRSEEAWKRLESICHHCEPQREMALLERALEWLADPGPALERLAHRRHADGQCETALENQSRALDLRLQSGEVEQAERLLREAWEWMPGDIERQASLLRAFEAHWADERLLAEHLALVKEHSGKLESALSLLATVRSRWPQSPEALAMEAEMLLEAGREADAVQRLREIAREAHRGDDLSRAIEVAQRITKLDSSTIADRWTLAELMRADGRKKAALQLLRTLAEEFRERNETTDLIRAHEAMLEIEPDHPGALSDLAETCAATGDIAGATKRWLQLAALHVRSKRGAPAERAYRQILEHDGDCVPALEGLFERYEEQENPRRLVVVARRLLEIHASQDWKRAERVAEHMAENHPDADDFFRRWADLLWERGDKSRAVQELETRAERMHSEGRTGAALDMLQHILLFLPERLDIAQRIGQIAFEMGDETRARRAWKEALAGHRALGDIDGEYQVLAQLHTLDPDDVAITASLADACLNLGHDAQALDLWLQTLARHRQANDTEQQRHALERIVSIDPSRPAEQRALGEILAASAVASPDATASARHNAMATEHLQRALGAFRAEERWDDAADTAHRLEQLCPDDPSIKQLRGEALAKAGREDDALEVFVELGSKCQATHDYLLAEIAWRAALDLVPDNLIAQEQLASILAAQGQADDAVALLERLMEVHRTSGDTEAEREVLLRITSLQPEHPLAHRRLAKLCLESDDIEGAWLSFRRLLAEAHQSGDEALWRELEQEVLAGSSDPRLRVELAQMHAEADRPDEAMRLFLDVAEFHRRADSPAGVRATAMMILHLDPHHLPALEMLLEALPALGDTTSTSLPTIKRRFAEALAMQGQPERALKLYEELVEEFPREREVQLGLAKVAMRLRQRAPFERALDHCVELAGEASAPDWIINVCHELLQGEDEPCPWPRCVRERLIFSIIATKAEALHVDAFVDLANDCEADGDIMRAVEVFESLVHALPDDTKVRQRFVDFLEQHGQHTRAVHELIALSQIHSKSGDRQRAVLTLERARGLDGENVQVLILIGEQLIAQNAKGRALELLQQAAQLAQAQGAGHSLPELRRHILSIDPDDMATRRALIRDLTNLGEREEAKEEHLALAERCLSKGLLDLAAQSYRAVVQIDPHNLEAWHNLVETHVQFAPEEDLVPDFLTVARLCQSEGKAREAAQWYRRFLNHSPDDVEVRKEFIETFEGVGSELDLMSELQAMAEVLLRLDKQDDARIWNQRADRLAEKMAKSPPTPPPEPSPKPPSRRPVGGARRPVVRVNGQRRAGGAGPRSQPGHLRAAGASKKHIEPPVGRKSHDTLEDPMILRLQQYQNHLESNPDNPKLHQQVAEILLHMGQMDEAHRHHRQAAELFQSQQAWAECASMCKRVLEHDADDNAIRRIMKEAEGRRD